MSLKDKLDIVLITYNRKACLEKTFEQIFAESSPIKDFDITVLDNHSNDGTGELIDKYSKKYPNLKHIVNKINIGGCANSAKAIVEIPQKEYAWILCDNDDYDWTNWGEIEAAIEQDYETIMTRNCKNTPPALFYNVSFLPAIIFKTSSITNTVAQNIYDFVPFMFPQLGIIANTINKNIPVYIVNKDIVHSGINPGHDKTFTRGLELENLSEARKHIFWSVGYFCTTELITDKKVRAEIIDGTRHFHKSLFDLFKSAAIKNKIFHKNYPHNFCKIFRMLNLKQKLQFLLAILCVNLSFKDYRYYEMRSKEDWAGYFERIGEQKYLDKLSKKYKGKKILLYGAGMLTEVLFENYDLSKFDIVGISDKRFERTGEKEFFGIKTILPNDIVQTDCDIILFGLKLHKKPAEILRKSGVKKQMAALIKKSSKYPVRS